MLGAAEHRRVLALGIERGTAIYDRVALLWPAVAGAAESDPDVAAYWRGVAARRHAGQRAMVGRLAELDPLRPGLDLDRAAELVGVLLGHDVYRALVLDAGWSPDIYREWLASTLAEQLHSAKAWP